MSPSISNSFVVHRNNKHALQLSNSPEQWKLSLQEVKLLYLRRQYKQCGAKSTKLLRKVDSQFHAIHKAFLHYYSAISYEALGRGAHNYSNNKLPLLNLARDNFATCKSSLAVALLGPVEKQSPRQQQQQQKPSKRKREYMSMNSKKKTYPATSPTNSCEGPHICVDDNGPGDAAPSPEPAQQSATGSPSSKVPRQGLPEKKQLMPSPLRIHKTYHNGYFQDQLVEHDPPSLPPPTRPLPELPPEANHGPPLPCVANNTTARHEPHAEASEPLFRPLAPQFYRHSIGFFPATPSPSSRRTNRSSTIHHHHLQQQQQQQQKINANSIFPLPQNSPLIPLMTSLSTQLEANIKSINRLISKTLELQRVHNAKKNSRLASFWSFTPTYDDDNVIANDPFFDHDNYGNNNNNNNNNHNNNNHPHHISTNGTTPTSTSTINGQPTTPLPANNNTSASTTTTTPATSGSSGSSNNSRSKNNNNNNNNKKKNNTSTPLSSSSPSSLPTDETREQRIARLKADGWLTVGLRSRKRGWKGAEYYERICNEALAELYGNERVG
ncbi:hypothetical protein ACJ72_07989 [Emergomyces africanus]|uniref:Uncharacterized protein n=1 Tax=Emergomyces africanus TaxID=1955775 RepID=A0A1B7NLK5_9EURO|nr:hypothetical protein ACJ72_07989 [Emergomyces africanus]